MKKPANVDPKLRSQMLALRDTMHKSDAPYRRASNIDFFLCLIFYVVLALAIRLFVFEPVLVSGDSMYPTLLDGERMFVEKLTYLVEPPQRGDIVICHYPYYDENCVKRVIGLPGETIEIAGGMVYIDGAPLEESAYWEGEIWQDMAPQLVPEDSVFVIGDNRNYSTDSRDRAVGPLTYGQIIGKVHFVIWPLEECRNVYTELSPQAGVPYTPPLQNFYWGQ